MSRPSPCGCVLPPGKLSASAWCALHHFTSRRARSAGPLQHSTTVATCSPPRGRYPPEKVAAGTSPMDAAALKTCGVREAVVPLSSGAAANLRQQLLLGAREYRLTHRPAAS